MGSIAKFPLYYQQDCEEAGFTWIVADDTEQSVFAWLRNGCDRGAHAFVVKSISRRKYGETTVSRFPTAGAWREVFNSDAALYGGARNIGNAGRVCGATRPTNRR